MFAFSVARGRLFGLPLGFGLNAETLQKMRHVCELRRGAAFVACVLINESDYESDSSYECEGSVGLTARSARFKKLSGPSRTSVGPETLTRCAHQAG